MRSDSVRLFLTLPHPCGYFAERIAQNLVIDPGAPNLAESYELAVERGYRRAGGHVYLPQCKGCQACIPCRVPVDRFTPDRSQRRCLARNADLAIDIHRAALTEERFDLYRRYLSARHPDGGMDHATRDDFDRFLYTAWSPTFFIEFRTRGRLVAVATTDFCRSGLSAVYTFFDPDEHARGLGSFAILSQIRIARQLALPHVYLGFWIEGHPKMHYKARYRPLEILRDGRWQDLDAPTA